MGDAAGPDEDRPDPARREAALPDAPPSVGSTSPWTARWPVLAKGLLLVAAALVAMLVLTGVVLSTEYQPSTAEAWPGLAGASEPDQTVRTLHRWASTLLIPVAIVLAVLGWALVVRRRSWVPTLGLVLAVVAAGMTGYMVAWDQVALRSVTVGGDLSGVWEAAFDADIRFLIVDGTEVSQATYRNALIAHLLLTAAAAAALVFVARMVLPRAASVRSGLASADPEVDLAEEPPDG